VDLFGLGIYRFAPKAASSNTDQVSRQLASLYCTRVELRIAGQKIASESPSPAASTEASPSPSDSPAATPKPTKPPRVEVSPKPSAAPSPPATPVPSATPS
jgi:hypothetical protein